MMNRGLRWMKGYVRFTAQVPDFRRVMDQIREQELHIWSLSVREVSLSGMVRASEYRMLAKIFRSCGGNIRVQKRSGFPFVLFRNRKRYGLFLGSLFFVVFLLYTQTFLWEIRLPDCEPKVAEQALTLLEEHGVTPGTPLSRLDEKKLQQELLMDSQLFSWIALNFSGTSVNVVFAQRVQQPTLDPDTPCDIVAKKAGQVLYIEAKHGTEVVAEKEVVLPGDLLISGVSVGTSDTVGHAEGRVIASTLDIQTRSFPLTQMEPKQLDSPSYGVTLSFFGWSLSVWNQTPKHRYEEAEQKHAVTLFGHELPIAATVQQRKPYLLSETTYSEEEAFRFLEQSMQEYENTLPADVTIIGYEDEVKTVDGICYLTRRYHCEENIAQKISLSVNER